MQLRPAAGGPRCMPSSVIRSYRYDPADRHLDLVFVSGRHYRYHDVPEEIYQEMRNAFSTGEYFNANIRDQFRHTREH
jgi:hypothetical protein